MLDNLSLMKYIIIVYIVGMFFSFVYWMEEHFGGIDKSNATVKYVEGVLHSLIGALIGVIVLSFLLEFYPHLSRVFDASVSVLAAILVDLVLFVLKKEVKDL